MSIYTVQNWQSNFLYKQNDIMKSGSFYYYAKLDHNSGAALNLALWNGTAIDFNGETKPLFIWKPSYNSPVKVTPRTKKTVFGNGYSQRISDGISNELLNLNVVFELRNNQEATAINHFLYSRQGSESFLFTPPVPFNQQKRFICEDWSDNYQFFSNHLVNATFEEVPI